MNFMFRMKNVGWTAFAAAAILVGLYEPAQAQWLPDRSYTQGPGIRVGNLELHPGVAVRGGYDNNIFRTEKNQVSSAILAVTPHLNIQTLSKQRLTEGEEAAGAAAVSSTLPAPIAFNLGAAGTFFKYFDSRGPTNIEIDTDGVLSVLPGRRLGLDIGASYARSIRPFTAYAGFDRNNLYVSDRVRPVLNLRAQSASGVLSGGVAYAPTFQLYENRLYNFLNNTQHDVTANAAWKFLPYTALIYDGTVSFTNYDNLQSGRPTILISSESTRFQSRLGVSGAITPNIGGRILVGYSVGSYKESRLDDFEDVIGEAAVNYRLGDNMFELGYQRAVLPAALGGWMLQDRGSFTASTLLARVIAVSLNAGLAHATYGRLLKPDGTDLGIDRKTNQATSHRTDLRADGGVHVEYRMTNWLALLGDFNVLSTRTDFRYQTGTPTPFAAQFFALQAFGGLRAHY